MCGVTVRQSREGKFKSIQTHYCDNHPACCTLRGIFIRSRDSSRTAPVSPATPTSGGSQAPGLTPVTPVTPTSGGSQTPGLTPVTSSGGGVVAVHGGGAHVTFAESAEGQVLSKNPASRFVRNLSDTASTLRNRFAKLRMPSLAGKNQHCCIRLSFAYRCGHPVTMNPPVYGWACSKYDCRHSDTTHIISVPLQFPCTWTERCSSQGVASRAVLYETVEGQPPWRAILMDSKDIEIL